MEFNFSPIRIGILVICLAVFAWLGGFSRPEIADPSLMRPARVAKAWTYCILLFCMGAASVSIVDHFVGTMDRSNIRLVYIVIGAALMIGAVLWLRGLRAAAETRTEETDTTCPMMVPSLCSAFAASDLFHVVRS